jgi:hypothetical protein
MSALADLVRDLEPTHQTMERFEKGGKQCARDIESIYTALVDLLDEFRDDDEDEE